ncbi:hypothetical protein [Mesorhizobium sp.]|uniref:hypothetical protein n=1 Tax=Mesorhizobium sp. TaxID=1871066 RepID=UPI000FE96E9C|nr:hypothetical protein [Mesorhizobium sp.]RWD28704.1 MAG: hypothetical protein EOS34_29865 [Mesorhizobium sp.]RWE98621.1 MAG: hypothetical protein EOS43_17595 [Mesorhizobium sp.]
MFAAELAGKVAMKRKKRNPEKFDPVELFTAIGWTSKGLKYPWTSLRISGMPISVLKWDTRIPMPVLPPCLLQSRFASLARLGQFSRSVNRFCFPAVGREIRPKANPDAKHFLDSKSNAHAWSGVTPSSLRAAFLGLMSKDAST